MRYREEGRAEILGMRPGPALSPSLRVSICKWELQFLPGGCFSWANGSDGRCTGPAVHQELL